MIQLGKTVAGGFSDTHDCFTRVGRRGSMHG